MNDMSSEVLVYVWMILVWGGAIVAWKLCNWWEAHQDKKFKQKYGSNGSEQQ